MPDYTAADKIIVLASLARIGQWKIRRTRIEIAYFTPNAEVTEALQEGTYVQTQPTLNYTSG